VIKVIVPTLALLAIAVLLSSLSTDVQASPYGAGKYSANVPYGGQTQLSIATSGGVNLSVLPTSGGTLATGSGTVTVTSTDVVGYKLYIRSVSTTNLTSPQGTIPASANVSPAALSVNTWGYNLDASSNFVGTSTSDILIRTATGPYTSGDVTTVTYGVRVNNSKPAGSYTTTVVYTAVPQTN
jgi:hypothetical protein